MVGCGQSTPYTLQTGTSKPNILHASTVDIPRDAVQIGVEDGRDKAGRDDRDDRDDMVEVQDEVEVGAEIVAHDHVNVNCQPAATSTTRPQETEAGTGGQGGPGRAGPRPRPSSGQHAQLQFQKISPTLPTVSSRTGLPPNPSAHGPAFPSNAGVLFQELPQGAPTLALVLASSVDMAPR